MPQSTCSVDGCVRLVHVKSRGLCRADYALLMRTGSTELAVTRRQREMDTDTHKACVACGEVKPHTEFYRSSKSKDGWRGSCKPCAKETNRASYLRNHETNLRRAREHESRPERKAYLAAYREWYIPATRSVSAKRSAERRATIRAATVDTSISVAGLRERHGDLCMYCDSLLLFDGEGGRKRDPRMASMEHVQPLSRGGAHSWANVRLACLGCNVAKNNKTAEEWQEYAKEVPAWRYKSAGPLLPTAAI